MITLFLIDDANNETALSARSFFVQEISEDPSDETMAGNYLDIRATDGGYEYCVRAKNLSFKDYSSALTVGLNTLDRPIIDLRPVQQENARKSGDPQPA